MSKQIKIRRGTAAEYETFVGAEGEITMDTTNKTLRVHDGVTPGGTILAKQGEGMPANSDYVIGFQTPSSSNNYTWYRKYKSGWIEQGGVCTPSGNGDFSITLPKVMQSSNYHFTATFIVSSTGITENIVLGIRQYNTSTKEKIYGRVTGIHSTWNGTGAWPFNWIVAGMVQ